MGHSSVDYTWRNGEAAKHFRSGISLHSHTNQSRETLQFLAIVGSRYRLMRRLMDRLERRSEANHGMPVNYGLGYWTPPAAPKLALDLERAQIERLGLAPMVSLTDHDNIRAWQILESEAGETRGPVSVEWTVPYGPQAFHLGVHNLPRARACEWMQILSAHTADAVEGGVKEILSALHTDPEVLIVFNHPMWDLYGVGKEIHAQLVDDFLRENGGWIHAIELNGLRNWEENRAAQRLGEKWGMVLISGGDRHGLEPNANINLTNADCFAEFVHEIREERESRILFLPQYLEPWKHRVLRSAIDVVSNYPDFPAGSQRWDERVYHPDGCGVAKPLAALWPDGSAPRAMRWSMAVVRMMGRGVFSAGLRMAWSEPLEVGRALDGQEEMPATAAESAALTVDMKLVKSGVTGPSE